MKRVFQIALCCVAAQILGLGGVHAQGKSLYELQQDFVDRQFGMFIHFNMPTYANADWPDPNASPELFNPTKLDCTQWAQAAKSAGMTYGCLTTKHHSGFCIWDTETTPYSVMNSPVKRDVVKEYADAFRAEGLGVALYYSILDTHHDLRPGHIAPHHIRMIKDQLGELLTGYGEIEAVIIDGWDAPWSRISYDEIPFEDIYRFIKSIQPNCLVLELNAAKYPSQGLFYTDIKSYEQGAGQHISKESNRLPALSCLPLQSSWFWKEDFPGTPVKSPSAMVDDNIVPMGEAYCNFLLNVAPNRDGLMDENALVALKEIGRLWKNDGKTTAIPVSDAPIISSNIAKGKPACGSWSNDMSIMDFAVDDDFGSAWWSNPRVKVPWLEIELGREQPFNMIVITEAGNSSRIEEYKLEYRLYDKWMPLEVDMRDGIVRIHRFDTVWADAVRLTVTGSSANPSVDEFGIYNERR
jgi:alpha-L-fucosidase